MRHIKPSSLGVSLVVFLPLLWKGITSQVTYPPGYSIKVSHSVSVQEGLGVTIPCTFTADGRNRFRNSFGYWIQMPRNSDYIVATNNKSSIVQKTNFHLTGNPNTGDCTLTITGARKEDERTYYFRFEESKDSKVKYNYYGEMTTTITVTDPITITWEMNGKIGEKSDIIEVTEGSSVILRCSVQSNLNLYVNWMYGKDNVLQRRTGKGQELRLENMTVKNSGTYTCSWNRNQRKNIRLTVQYPPRNMTITIRSSKGEERPASPQVNINQNEALTLVCSAEGNPPVTVVWMRGEDDVDTYNISNNGLSAVINVTSSEADVYQCLAWNGLGLRERRIKIGTKQGHGEEPNNIHDTNLSQGIAIGFICGLSIATLIFLLYILYTRKKMTKKNTDIHVKEMSASAESQRDDTYMDPSTPDPMTEEAAYSNVQVTSGGAARSEDTLLYSTINFAAKCPKAPSSQPEPEYAKVRIK